MATERSTPVTTGNESSAKWTSWLAALVGLWVLVTPFVLSGPIGTGTVFWSNVVGGAIVAIFAAYTAYTLRSTGSGEWLHEWSGWLAAVVGLWVVISPFVLTGSVTASSVMWSNVGSGALIAVFAGYGGFGVTTA